MNVVYTHARRMLATPLSATNHKEISALPHIFGQTKNVPPRCIVPTCKSLRLKTPCL